MNARTIRDAVPAFSRASHTATAQQIIRAARRSAVLRSPAAFAAHELLGSTGRIGRHDLVDGGIVILRHRTRDVDIFDEVLVPPRAYDPPPQVATRLARMTRPRVIDLGGNIGLFALDCIKRHPDVCITSIEPDPTNLPILNFCCTHNRNPDWTIMPVAAGIEAGTVRFTAGLFADSAVSDHGAVEVPMVDVFPLLADADFIKIDIEGSEWPILLDDRFLTLRAPVVVLEWHKAGAPPGDVRETVLARLTRAGYRAHANGSNHHGVAWAWR